MAVRDPGHRDLRADNGAGRLGVAQPVRVEHGHSRQAQARRTMFAAASRVSGGVRRGHRREHFPKDMAGRPPAARPSSRRRRRIDPQRQDVDGCSLPRIPDLAGGRDNAARRSGASPLAPERPSWSKQDHRGAPARPVQARPGRRRPGAP